MCDLGEHMSARSLGSPELLCISNIRQDLKPAVETGTRLALVGIRGLKPDWWLSDGSPSSSIFGIPWGYLSWNYGSICSLIPQCQVQNNPEVACVRIYEETGVSASTSSQSQNETHTNSLVKSYLSSASCLLTRTCVFSLENHWKYWWPWCCSKLKWSVLKRPNKINQSQRRRTQARRTNHFIIILRKMLHLLQKSDWGNKKKWDVREI